MPTLPFLLGARGPRLIRPSSTDPTYQPAHHIWSLCHPLGWYEKQCKMKNLGCFGVSGHPRSPSMSPFDRVHVYDFLLDFYIDYASILYRFPVMASYLSKVAYFNLLDLHLALPLVLTPFEFRQDLWYQKTRVPGILCGVVSMIRCLTVLTLHWRMTEREMDGRTYRHTTTAHVPR